MNRKQFLKTVAVGTGALVAAPFTTFAIAPRPKISWKDFDWMVFPSELAFRIEVKDGVEQFASIPYMCVTRKLQMVETRGNVDLTKETITKDWNEGLPKVWHREENQGRFKIIHTNETLLLAAKEMGFTHIYMFVRVGPLLEPETYRVFYQYKVRGATLPDWKTNRGKLQVVTV